MIYFSLNSALNLARAYAKFVISTGAHYGTIFVLQYQVLRKRFCRSGRAAREFYKMNTGPFGTTCNVKVILCVPGTLSPSLGRNRRGLTRLRRVDGQPSIWSTAGQKYDTEKIYSNTYEYDMALDPRTEYEYGWI
jgi:hypothetical protein